LAAAQDTGNSRLATPEGNRQRAVLVLALDDFQVPYIRLIHEAVGETLASSPERPALYFESLDAARFGEPGYLESVRTWLRHKFAGRRIDLVLPLGQDAFDFLAAQRGEPWPDARVLFLDTGAVKVSLPQAGALQLESHIAGALQVIRAILPDTRQIAFIQGGSAVEQARYASYATAARTIGIEPIVLSGLTSDQILERAAALPAHTVAVLLAPAVDANGHVLTLGRLCAEVSAAASVPLFTFGIQDVGCGVVGGSLRDWTLVGRLLAQEALAQLRLPVSRIVNVPAADYTSLIFDARQLQRWKISESNLPAGSDVRFREPNLWRDHRALILTALGVMAMQTVLIGGLLIEHRRRRRAEAQSRHSLLESRRHLVASAHLDRRAAMGELATSLAHELNQPLNGILQNVDVADMLLAAQPLPETRDQIVEIIGDIRKADLRASEVIRRMRGLLQRHELESKAIDLNDVAREAIAIVRPDATARDVALEAELQSDLSPINGDSVHLQQVLLNLLLNALDAAAGMPAPRRLVRVRTTQENGNVRVSVTDRGFGIATARVSDIFEPFVTTKGGGAGMGMGMGLAIARGIIEAHGGCIGAENNPDGGATVWFSVPVTAKVHV
jgi:signal transduction histidine kinase